MLSLFYPQIPEQIMTTTTYQVKLSGDALETIQFQARSFDIILKITLSELSNARLGNLILRLVDSELPLSPKITKNIKQSLKSLNNHRRQLKNKHEHKN